MQCRLICLKHDNKDGCSILGSSGLIDEVDSFSVLVESERELGNHLVLITDIPLRLEKVGYSGGNYWYTVNESSVRSYFESQNFDKSFDLYCSKHYVDNVIQLNLLFYKIFINYPIGRCEIKVIDEEAEEQLAVFNINVTSSKIENSEFASLIGYIEDKGSHIWAKYSLIMHQAISSSKDDKLEWLIMFCRDFIQEFNTKYLLGFTYDKIKTLISQFVVHEYKDHTNVSEESMFWIMQNLDQLVPTVSYDTNKILINNRQFVAKEILSSDLCESTDNSENRLVHGFVSELIFFLNEIRDRFKEAINLCQLQLFSEFVEFYSFKMKVKSIDEMLMAFEKIKLVLNQEIPVKSETVEVSSLNKVESKEHYYFVYQKLLEWFLFRTGDYAITSSYFKGIDRLDHLFERACFYKIVDALETLGYKIEILEGAAGHCPRKIRFSQGYVTNYLYYQAIPDELVTTKKGSFNLLPDFIIKLQNQNYLIIDAKYKKEKNISRFDLSELVIKYLHGIGPKSGGRFKSIALLVLFPDKESSQKLFHKDRFSPYGDTVVKPVIGNIGVNFEEKSVALETILKRIFELS